MNMQFEHKLMSNNFTDNDIKEVIKLLKRKERVFTQSKNVIKFEKLWSKWLGVKYSVFVNSGSSANLLSLTILKILKGKGEVIVPSLTWVSDISSVLQNNFTPIFVDINPKNLCMSEDQVMKKVNKKTVAVSIPKHKIARNLLNIIKVPLAAPSANISSKLSPTSAKDVVDEFKNKIKFVLDGGQCRVGVESTIVDLTNKPKILRPGIITLEKINKVLNIKVKIDTIISAKKEFLLPDK